MPKTLKKYSYSCAGNEIFVTCVMDDSGNEVQASSTVKPDKNGAAYLKQLNDWVEDYVKTKYQIPK